MGKGKFLIAILLIFVLLAGTACAVYYFGFHDKERTKTGDETPPDNTEIVQALQRIIGLLENGIENQASVNENIISRFGELSERIENDRDDIDGVIAELDNIFTTLFTLEAEIGAFENYDDTAIYGLYNGVLGSLSNLINDNNILAISHSDLFSLYNGLQTFVNKLANDIRETSLDLETVKTDIQAFKQAVVSLLSDYSEISASLDNAITDINSLTADFDIFNTDFTALNNTVAGIQTTLSALDSGYSDMFTALQSDIADIQNRLTAHDSALQALQNAVDGLLSTGSALDGRVGNIESVISALESTVSYLAAELSRIGSLPDYSWDIYTLNQRVEALENTLNMLSDYAPLDGRVYNLENEIWFLQNRIWELENRLDEMQAHKPVELLDEYFVFNPDNYEDNIFVIPYDIAWQLAEKDSFKITVGIVLYGNIFVTRTVELRLFCFGEYPITAVIDGISVLGIEWLMAVGLFESCGEYILQFETEVTGGLFSIMEMRVLSIEYIKGGAPCEGAAV